MGFKELTGGRWLFLTLLGLPELQQGFEHMQAVVYRSHAEQSGSSCVGDERRRLERKQMKLNYLKFFLHYMLQGLLCRAVKQ